MGRKSKADLIKAAVESAAELSTRPADYIPQPGNKATLTLADFSDDNIFAELRRRGFNGELRFTKVVTV